MPATDVALMPDDFSSPPPLSDPIVKWLLGFFGAIFGFLLLPKTLKLVFRKLVFGTVAEIVAIVLTGLLTEKAVEFLGKEEGRTRLGR
ncbi:MAG: hypothetical protein R3247_09535 [Rhodothermales bacterium]|nr:hypothetical protein [Rhodothermales bacterium]